MPRLVLLCAAALALCALAVSTLSAQFRTTTPSRPMVYHDLVYLGDAALHKELTLSAEQVKKIAAVREARLTAFPATSRTKASARRMEEATRDTEKFLADTLDARQRQRLRQVVWQQLGRNGLRQAPPAALADLKLTAEQRASLTAPDASLDAVLSKQQMQTWAKMIGAPFAQSLVAQIPAVRGGGGMRGRASAPVSATMRLLTSAAGGKELAISAEQQKQLDHAGDQWREAVKDYRIWTVADRPAHLAKANSAYEQAVTSILKRKQADRLDQILLQQEVGGNELALFINARAMKRLGLTEEQQKNRDQIIQKQREKLAGLLRGDETPARLQEKARTALNETREQLEAVLTAPQRDKLKNLLGPAFVDPSRSRGRAPALRVTLLARELAYLAAAEFAVELKLTGEQARKVADLRQHYEQESPRLGFGAGDTVEARRKLLEKYDKEYTTVLGADRRKRFRQMVLQVLEKQVSRGTVLSGVWALPEVEQELKLSQEQVRQLATASADKVLSAEQQKRWKAMKGERFEGTLTLPFSGLGRGARNVTRTPPLPVPYRYLAQPVVQNELRLTKAQAADVAQLQAKWTEATTGYLTWTPAERAGKLEKAAQAVDDWLKKRLQPAQAKRLQQIVMQNLLLFSAFGGQNTSVIVAPPGLRMQSATRLPIVLLYPPAAKSLELTDKQRQRVAELFGEYQRGTTLIRTELNRLPNRNGDDLLAKTLAAHLEQTEKKLQAVLTQKQRDAAKELLGEPFKGAFSRPDFNRGTRLP